jgi:glycosyltransferase involved in cell wall biosynthesis
MYCALKERVAELIPIIADKGLSDAAPGSDRALHRRLARRIGKRVYTFDGSVRGLEHLWPGRLRRRTLARAHAVSRTVSERAAAMDVDVVFGCFVSWHLCRYDAPTPVVYYTDATTRIINTTYPAFVRRGRGFKEACDEIEGAALQRAHTALFASEFARRSAVDDFGLPANRSAVVPLGATVLPAGPEEIDPEPPPARTVRLCIVAADPVRKRLDLVIEATEALAAEGWDARLTYIGPPTPRAKRSPVVECAGRLRLSSDTDRATHRAILSSSHLLVLPSLAEAFGIAPAEAAHFGRPSVVSAAGGLPTVVQHGRTGIVMPMASSAADYAREIARLCSDADAYRAMSAAALDRARGALTWDRCADAIVEHLEIAAASRRAGVAV